MKDSGIELKLVRTLTVQQREITKLPPNPLLQGQQSPAIIIATKEEKPFQDFLLLSILL
jgi:hypothetical protein